MAKEYIERDALLRDIEDSVVFSVGRGEPSAELRGAGKIVDRIRCAPAADVVEVVHGCWVGTADGYADGELVYDMWECSECGYDADGADEKPNWNFCPNCGADMRERRTDE